MEEKEVNEPLEKDQTEIEKEIEEELKQENIEITDLASYIANVKGVSAQTKQDIDKLMELLKEAPKVGALAAGKMGKQAIEAIGKTTNQIKRDFMAGVKTVRKTIETEIGNAKDAVDEYSREVGKGFSEIEYAEVESNLGVGVRAAAEDVLDEKWAGEKKEEGKSSDSVVDTVKEFKKSSRDIRTKVALGAVKVAGFVGKGLALFGKKDLAKEMVGKVGQYGERFVSKDSRIGNIMQRGAEAGFVVVDATKQFGKDAKQFAEDRVDDVKQFGRNTKAKAKDIAETAAMYGMVAKDKVKDGIETAAIYGMVAGDKVKETAKDGAIALGKATYKTVGIATGIGEYAVESVTKVAKEKIVDPGMKLASDVKENIIDPSVKTVTEKAGQTKTLGGKLWDLAVAKVNQVKNLPTNLRGRAENLLKAAADKIAPTLADQKLVDARNTQVNQKSQEARGAFNTLTGKENDSQEPQQKTDGDAR